MVYTRNCKRVKKLKEVTNMTKTFVLNLITGEQKYYNGDPVAAVKSAYIEEQGLESQYEKRRGHMMLPVVDGKRIVSCGHWTARKEELMESCC